MERLKRIVWCTLWLAALYVGLTGGTGASSEPAKDATRMEKTQTAASVTPGQCRVRYAKGFAIVYREGYKVVTVFEPGRAENGRMMDTFILVPRGTRPQVRERGTVVEVPVMRAALRSSTHVPFFSMLGRTDRIAAITQRMYVNDPDACELIRKGRIVEVGVGSGMTAQFNMERLLTLHPDLVLSWWTNNPAFAGHIKAKEAGFPVAVMADYEENTPLGRTEWIKFVAAFLDAEADAERVFSDVERRYLALAKKTKGIHSRPTVMYGNSFEGSWYIAGGKSLFANLVEDAGGRYVWRDNPDTGSKPVNVESAIMRGRNADYWITQNQNHVSLASVLAEDSRYRLFNAFRSGRIYSVNGKIGPGGGNDYYQGTVAHPELLLADMIAVLHPDLLPDHRLIWHVRLPPHLRDRAGKG